MKAYKIPIAIIILSFSLFSCSNLQQLTTYWEADMQTDTIKPTGFDAATKVGWTSYNDSTHLYFAVDLLDSRVQMSVMSGGLTIFLDTTGKMKEGTSVTYPLIKRAPVKRDASARQSNSKEVQNPIHKILENTESMELRWTKDEHSYLVNPAVGNSDFITLVAMDSLNYVSLLIGVPMKMIHPLGIDGLNELTVGFGIPMAGGRAGGAGMGGQQSMGSGGGGGRSGGGGGGRGGGGGGSRGGGGSQMGGGAPMGGSSSGPTLEKFWYQTVITKGINE